MLQTSENPNASAMNTQQRPMESPVIVKSINRGITSMREDALEQAVNKTPQTITNKQGYDLMYPTHKSFYEDKKYFVFDSNYNTMENALVKTFEDAVNEGFGQRKLRGKQITHVDEIKDRKLNFNWNNIPGVSISDN